MFAFFQRRQLLSDRCRRFFVRVEKAALLREKKMLPLSFFSSPTLNLQFSSDHRDLIALPNNQDEKAEVSSKQVS
jgi:hypothetical protein